MTAINKTPPSKTKYSRKPTITLKKCRWVVGVPLDYISIDGDRVQIATKLDVQSKQDNSLASTGTRGFSKSKRPFYREGNHRFWYFNTHKGVEITDLDGNPTTVEEGDVVSLRFTPIIVGEDAHFALEVVVKH